MGGCGRRSVPGSRSAALAPQALEHALAGRQAEQLRQVPELAPKEFRDDVELKLLKHFDAKNKFLRKFIPLIKPTREFARERDAAVRRAEAAEASAYRVVQAELSSLREENRALRDQNFELTGSARGKFSVPTAFWPSFFVRILLFSCLCSPRVLRVSVSD